MATRRSIFLALVVSLVFPTIGWTQGLPVVAPGDVGLSSERLERLEQVVQGYIDANAVAGAVTLVARKGGQAHLQAYGMADRATGRAMTTDAIF